MNRNRYSKRDARIGLALNYFFIYLNDDINATILKTKKLLLSSYIISHSVGLLFHPTKPTNFYPTLVAGERRTYGSNKSHHQRRHSDSNGNTTFMITGGFQDRSLTN